MKFLTMEEQLNYYRSKRIKKQTLESYFISSGFQYIEPAICSPMISGQRGQVKVIDGKGDIYELRSDMTEGIIQQLGNQAIESSEIKLYYDGKIFISDSRGGIRTRDQMGVEWIGGNVSISTQELIKLSAQTILHQKEKVVMEISHIAYFMALINRYGIKEDDVPAVQQLLNSKSGTDLQIYLIDKGYSEECAEAFSDLLQLKGSWERVKEKLLNKSDIVAQKVLADLQEVEEGLKVMETNGEVHFDLSIIPSYDYYTGVVFKGFSSVSYKELISGGQYLIETGRGRKINAVGFSLYEGALQ